MLFAACVSKKNYVALQDQNKQLNDEKSQMEDVLNKLAVENDSLKKENMLLDSLYRVEKEKNDVAVTDKKDNYKPKYKKNTLSESEEYDKKALFIYNFTSYVSWPSFKGNEFLIGIVGDSPIDSYITNYTKGKISSKAPIVVEKFMPARNYQIIFIASSGAKNFSRIKKDYGNKQTLIVTENPWYNKSGGHIGFYVDGDKVNFTINKSGIEKSGMNVSSKLINFSQNQ